MGLFRTADLRRFVINTVSVVRSIFNWKIATFALLSLKKKQNKTFDPVLKKFSQIFHTLIERPLGMTNLIGSQDMVIDSWNFQGWLRNKQMVILKRTKHCYE